MKIAIAMMLLVSFAAHKRYWKDSPSESLYVVAGVLGGEHDRVCGVVTPSPTIKDGWWFTTLPSGGARVGLRGDGLSSLHAAKLAVEGDCR